MAGVIVVLLLVVVFPALSRDEGNFCGEDIHANMARLGQQTEGYHRDYGAFSHGFPRDFSRMGANFSANEALPREYPLVVLLPGKEIGKIR